MNTEKKEVPLKSEEKEFSVEDIYTPLSVAKEEIWRRWNDKELRKKVENFLGGDIPKIFGDCPRAVLARHITSPNYEFLYFMDVIGWSELKPAFVEYIDDSFSFKNKEKYHLCKPYFENGISESWIQRTKAVKMIDFNEWEGESLKSIETKNGKNIVDVHRCLLPKNLNIEENICDISEWLKKKGGKPKLYYSYYLALFVCYGILFENFSVKEAEAEHGFTNGIVYPAIKKIMDEIGIKPLIVPLLPIENEDNLHWWSYPMKEKEKLNNFLKQK